MDLVRGHIAMDKKMREEHIGFILREVIKVNFRELPFRLASRRGSSRRKNESRGSRLPGEKTSLQRNYTGWHAARARFCFSALLRPLIGVASRGRFFETAPAGRGQGGASRDARGIRRNVERNDAAGGLARFPGMLASARVYVRAESEDEEDRGRRASMGRILPRINYK